MHDMWGDLEDKEFKKLQKVITKGDKMGKIIRGQPRKIRGSPIKARAHPTSPRWRGF
jgi:hypothetical protein